MSSISSIFFCRQIFFNKYTITIKIKIHFCCRVCCFCDNLSLLFIYYYIIFYNVIYYLFWFAFRVIWQIKHRKQITLFSKIDYSFKSKILLILVSSLAKVSDRNSFRTKLNYYVSFRNLSPGQCESIRTNPKKVLKF